MGLSSCPGFQALSLFGTCAKNLRQRHPAAAVVDENAALLVLQLCHACLCIEAGCKAFVIGDSDVVVFKLNLHGCGGSIHVRHEMNSDAEVMTCLASGYGNSLPCFSRHRGGFRL